MWNLIYNVSKDVMWYAGSSTLNLGYYLIYGKQQTPEERIDDNLVKLKASEELILIELRKMQNEIHSLKRELRQKNNKDEDYIEEDDKKELIPITDLSDSFIDVGEDIEECKIIDQYQQHKNDIQYMVNYIARRESNHS